MSSPRLCVVLAGGAGRRMGGGKPQRQYRTRSLGEQALSLAAGFASRVALSVRDRRQADGLPPVELVFDPPGIEGPLAGVVGSLTHGASIGAAHVLTIPCDAPHLPSDLYNKLEEALERNPVAFAAVASDGLRDHPACTLWRTPALGHVMRYAQTGRRSLQGLLPHLDACRVLWSDCRADAFVNLNTLEDLARACNAAPDPAPRRA